MNIPPSEHFTPVSLAENYNVDRVQLEGFGGEDLGAMYGSQSILGMPFDLGAPGEPNGILLDGDAVRVDMGGVKASYVLFLHGVENRVSNYQDGLADFAMDGNELGDHVSDYVLEYADGESEATRILRRFAIQQSRIGWGASAFAAMPAAKPGVVMGATDEHGLGRRPASAYGRAETRHSSGRDGGRIKLWVYALPNPNPEKPIGHLTLVPKKERSAGAGDRAYTGRRSSAATGCAPKIEVGIARGRAVERKWRA